VCYDFKERRIVPTHYTIRTNWRDPRGVHLKSWLVETSAEGKNWREVDHQKNNKQFNGGFRTNTLALTSGRECRFIRLVNIGRNHFGNDILAVSVWEIFAELVE
jgi:hypothetical protein